MTEEQKKQLVSGLGTAVRLFCVDEAKNGDFSRDDIIEVLEEIIRRMKTDESFESDR